MPGFYRHEILIADYIAVRFLKSIGDVRLSVTVYCPSCHSILEMQGSAPGGDLEAIVQFPPLRYCNHCKTPVPAIQGLVMPAKSVKQWIDLSIGFADKDILDCLREDANKGIKKCSSEPGKKRKKKVKADMTKGIGIPFDEKGTPEAA